MRRESSRLVNHFGSEFAQAIVEDSSDEVFVFLVDNGFPTLASRGGMMAIQKVLNNKTCSVCLQPLRGKPNAKYSAHRSCRRK